MPILRGAFPDNQIDCPLAFGDNPNRLCAWCGEDLRPLVRRRRWCSAACMWAFVGNHFWTDARRAAIRRDGARCTQMVLQSDGTTLRCPIRRGLEVNHVIPCLGRHGTGGCHHHLENLETLCHSHHVMETAAQRARGEFA